MPRMEGRVWKKVDYIVVILQSKFTIQKGEDKKVNVKSLYFTSLARKSHHLVLVVQTLDSAIYGINHYPADSVMISVLFIHWIALSNVWTTGAWLTNLRSTVRSPPESTLPHLTDIKSYSKHGLCIATPHPHPLIRFFSDWRGWLVIGYSKLLVDTRKERSRNKDLRLPPGDWTGEFLHGRHTPTNCSNPCS